MIDTHCHINFPQYDDDRAELIERAMTAGVDTMIIPGTTLETCASAIALAEQYDNIYAAAGIHPTDVADVTEETFEALDPLLDHPRVVALGEVGMDFYHDATLQTKQRECMERFVSMAKDKEKPLIIHNRDSEEAMAEFLDSVTLYERPGVFHCFAGDVDFARVVLDHGFYISFTGIVTFKNAKELQAVAEYVPLDRILLETDSPYLTPHPFRGRRNEPAYTRYVGEKIAELKGLSVDEVDRMTTQSAKNLFVL